MDIKKIGKIQIIIGVIFLVMTIIGAVLAGIIFYNLLTESTSKMTGLRSMDTENSVDIEMLVDHITIELSIVLSSVILVIGIVLILILASLMMISQGLINKNKKINYS